ncbi:MAG: class I SAM-dependent methyltransferase [Phycisphaerales bacterium]|nr:class I SAM-dependent methyltransferase [Phycisphaerales bacterium]
MSDTSPNPIPKPSSVYAKTRLWPEYFSVTAGRPPRETLLEALDLFKSDQPPISDPLAIDFGCGEGRDTAELLRNGWRVHAIDGHPEGIKRLIDRDDLVDPTRLTMQLAPFEAVELPPCDLLNASYSLPFCRPESFDAMWNRIVDSIRPGGRFAGQLFGDRHSWAKIDDRSHQAAERVEQLLSPFDVESLKEEDREGEDCNGEQTHWHVFHIIARKPIGSS